jgi:hypothetical protein
MPTIDTAPKSEIDLNNELEIIETYFQFMNEHNPDDSAEYLEEKSRQVMQGSPTWVRRNLDDTIGKVFDFFMNGRHVGFIDIDETSTVTAYMNGKINTESPEKIYENKSGLPKDFILSVALIEQVADIEYETKRLVKAENNR